MEKFKKMEEESGQFNGNFDDKNEEKESWRELVGEDIFREKMLELKIGPGLWDTVVTDESGKILKVNCLTFAEWKEQNRKMDRSTKSGNEWYDR